MKNVWDTVVQDLQNYKPNQQKTFLMKILEVFNNGCTGDCAQGRHPCNCEKRNG
jgi:hypothetical protein